MVCRPGRGSSFPRFFSRQTTNTTKRWSSCLWVVSVFLFVCLFFNTAVSLRFFFLLFCFLFFVFLQTVTICAGIFSMGSLQRRGKGKVCCVHREMVSDSLMKQEHRVGFCCCFFFFPYAFLRWLLFPNLSCYKPKSAVCSVPALLSCHRVCLLA